MPFKDANVKVWVSKVERDDKVSQMVVSTSRKDPKNEGKYLYSNWYVKLLGDAQKKVIKLLEKYVEGDKNGSGFLKKKFPVVLKNLTFTNEPYESKEGAKVYKNLQIVCWDWGWPEDSGGTSQSSSGESAFPFPDEE